MDAVQRGGVDIGSKASGKTMPHTDRNGEGSQSQTRRGHQERQEASIPPGGGFFEPESERCSGRGDEARITQGFDPSGRRWPRDLVRYVPLAL